MEVRNKIVDVLYDTIPNPVVTFDQNNKLVDCNQYFLDKMGFSKDEIMEMYAPDFLTEESKKTFYELIFPSLKGGKLLRDIDLHVKKKNGGFFHSLWSHITMWDEKNEYMGFTAIGLDLTEIDKLKDELIKKEKWETLGQLAGNLAHDIRNPLTVIKNSTEIITRERDDPLIRREYPRIQRSIKRIGHQVEEVLGFIKNAPMHFVDSNILEIFDQTISSIDIPQNIELKMPEKNLTLKCDSEKIEVLFVNIMLNAIQAIEKSPGTITIRWHDENDKVLIDIENDGPPISEENKNKIFQPLFTTKFEGTGLGLSICDNIVSRHGGKIMVKTNPVCFTIILPKKEPNPGIPKEQIIEI